MVGYREALLETHSFNLFMGNLEVVKQLLVLEHERGVRARLSHNCNKLQCFFTPAEMAK